MKRRLAAILAADVVGYSRLMRADEEGTIAALLSMRRDLIDPKVIEHHGRIVKLMGDGMLAEFASAVDAVRAAVETQQKVATHNIGLPGDKRIEFRVGINLGDVVIEGDDIYGDGINVAARLEALAEPGGVCVSGKVYEEVRDRLNLAFRDLGEQEVKNINRPVRVWHWVSDPGVPASDGSSAKMHLSMPEKPSIAVLPFDNMSGDPEQEYFADGITEDLITDLSCIRWLFVIARNSTFTYKGKATDVRQVSRDLGVRYVLEGSVRKSANRVRITAQLIDATTSAHIWAERYDRDLIDIFDLQDEITRSVAAAVEPQILAAEGIRARERSEMNLDAWDMVMRALSTYWHMSAEASATAIAILEEATQKHPRYAPARSMLAFALLFSGHMGWSPLAAESRERAARLATEACNSDGQDAWGHIALGYLHALNRDPSEGVLEFTKAINLNPNFAAAYGWRGFTRAHGGQTEDAISDVELSLRLSPIDPQNAIFETAAGVAHYLAGRYEKAAEHAEEGARLRPGFVAAHRVQCAALAQSGRMPEARAAFERVKERQPHVSASVLRATLPYSTPENLEKFIEGLSMAGMPE